MYGVRVYRAHQQSAGHRELCTAPAPPRPTLLCIHAACSRVVLNDCARISRNQDPAQHCSFGREETECWAAAAHNFHVCVRCLDLARGPVPRAGRAALTRHMLSLTRPCLDTSGPRHVASFKGLHKHTNYQRLGSLAGRKPSAGGPTWVESCIKVTKVRVEITVTWCKPGWRVVNPWRMS